MKLTRQQVLGCVPMEKRANEIDDIAAQPSQYPYTQPDFQALDPVKRQAFETLLDTGGLGVIIAASRVQMAKDRKAGRQPAAGEIGSGYLTYHNLAQLKPRLPVSPEFTAEDWHNVLAKSGNAAHNKSSQYQELACIADPDSLLQRV
jgi:hypothetical protein